MMDLERFIVANYELGDDALAGCMLAFQAACESTAVYPGSGNHEIAGLMYCGLGLTGEAGEVAEEIKRAYRNGDQQLSAKRRDKIEDELGDLLWYVAQTCNELGLVMDEVMLSVARKLKDRRERGALATGDPGGGAERVTDSLTHD
jgi:NTP pyrophosphatase (non-canonical NTP hydrolase)